MKRTLALPLAATLLLGLVATSGCKSTGADRVDQTSSRLDQLGTTVKTLQEQVTGTSAALDKVVADGATDPKPAFKEFSGQYDKLSSSAGKARSGLERAQAEGTKLFEEWTKHLDSFTDADLRKASEKRRDTLQKAFDSMSQEATKTLADLDAYVASAKDLHTYLSQDLTPAGIKSVSGKAKDLAKSAKSVSGKLGDLLESTTDTAKQFATAKPPPPPPKS